MKEEFISNGIYTKEAMGARLGVSAAHANNLLNKAVSQGLMEKEVLKNGNQNIYTEKTIENLVKLRATGILGHPRGKRRPRLHFAAPASPFSDLVSEIVIAKNKLQELQARFEAEGKRLFGYNN